MCELSPPWRRALSICARARGTTPDSVLRALAAGMKEMPDYFQKLCKVNGASVNHRQADGNYPYGGTKTFGYVSIEQVPNFDPAATYPFVSSYVPIHRAAGVRLFKVIEDNVTARNIRVMLSTSAERLIVGAGRELQGVRTNRDGRRFNIKARRAVILACGGFEASPDMQLQYWQEKPVLNAAFVGNTGDGIRMAQDVGAALWHMWHYHGVYGFKHPDPDYPFGIRPKRLPDWIPGEAARPDVKMPWIIVDRQGRRYMNEYQPYTQDTTWRAMAVFDGHAMSYLRIPSYMIMDEAGRGAYPIVSPTFNDRRFKFTWSDETLRDLEARILRKADSISELATLMGVDAQVLSATVAEWNDACRRTDSVFGRPPSSMVKIVNPPFYVAEVWPVCSNTHGGPVHDAEQRVLDAFGEAIEAVRGRRTWRCFWAPLYLWRQLGRVLRRRLDRRKKCGTPADLGHRTANRRVGMSDGARLAGCDGESARSVGTSVRRIEDFALLTGRAAFVDDIKLDGVLSAAFVRSPHAHALIRNRQVAGARHARRSRHLYVGRSAAAPHG